ncbi:RICIN domain-containing protein [Streptomyces coacervatus]|uniref:RICIN domain-containing protein n=1 Tax=Streptomyces coacervatus TaxID=647381 RepID=A0ABP7I435_9ACTN|nr:RICIN domain-containing protein [Streptomyces coacervatus]MDF2266971.1 RICIN domain-containing protein [Streptomyces coacervatus]
MARADGTGSGVETGGGIPETGGGIHANTSDARLVELLRTSTPTAYPALQEVRTRHQPAVLAYARLCTTSDSAAAQLAAQTFTLAARQTARGTEPLVPLRLQLLLLTAQLAAAWATDERAGGLAPDLLPVLSTTAPDIPTPPMLAAYQALPSRAQGLLWYGMVEREPTARTAVLLGLTPEDVAHETAAALQTMGQTCLRTRLAASEDPRCGNFGRLIGEAVRPDNPRTSTDLRAHMVHCAHCTAAYEELSALRDAPRTALAEGLLPWAGTAYATRDAASPRPRSAPRAKSPTRPKALSIPATWPLSQRVLLTSVALGVALTPLLIFLLSQGGPSSSPSEQAAGAVGTAPTPTLSAIPLPSATNRSPSPSPSPTPTRTHPKSPSPSKSASKSARPSPKPSPTHAPNGTYAQVVNVSSGLCLDVRDGDFQKGTDVVTAPCSSSRTQRWRVDSARGVVQSYADPDFCLDSRGNVDRGVGIWECSSVYGGNGQNLRFTVDPDGVIRPAIAIETAVTPNGGGDGGDGDGLSLEPLSGGGEQRWRAGAR